MRDANPSDAILDRLLSLHPKIIDLTLDRVYRVLEALGNPQNQLPPVVHIAGTNGKGSTLAMIRAGLEAAGSQVHAYTSPHLVRFHERIRLSGELIGEPQLEALLAECEAANGADAITFFEITTAAALLAFTRTPADFTLLEVGLGGRLDATNVVDRPALTVITPVSIDHQQYLGDTLGAIAGEKAGILKRNVPCIVGPQPDEAMEAIVEQAYRVQAPLLSYGEEWMVREEHGRVVYEDDKGLLDLDPPRLAGAHQIQNAGVAVAALRVLGQDESACQAALLGASWPARMQRLKSGALVDLLPASAELWLDGGHNEAAGEAIAGVLDDWHATGRRPVYAIVGMLETKSAKAFLRPLSTRLAELHCLTIPDTAASFDGNVLTEIAVGAGAKARVSASVQDSLTQIARHAEGPYRVLICGSLYLAGHVLGLNG